MGSVTLIRHAFGVPPSPGGRQEYEKSLLFVDPQSKLSGVRESFRLLMLAFPWGKVAPAVRWVTDEGHTKGFLSV